MINQFFKENRVRYAIYVVLGLSIATIVTVAVLGIRNRQHTTGNIEQREAQQEQPTEDLTRVIAEAAETIRAAQQSDIVEVNGFTFGNTGLLITDQQVGNAIVVDLVVLERPAFIVIYYEQDQKPGEVLNASMMLPAGVFPVVSIAAPQGLTTEAQYFAAIHLDSDRNGSFDKDIDMPLSNENDEILTASFSAIEQNKPKTPS